MGRRVEAAGHYLLSVAEKVVGRDAYMRLSAPERPLNTRGNDILAGAYQAFILPATTDTLVDLDTDKPIPILSGAKVVVSLFIIDPAAAWILPAMLSHGSLAEFAAWKIAGHVATHVGMDVIGAGARGVNRLFRNFRPSTPTLVV